jgi:hypothetical protein
MPIRFRCAYCNQLMGIARRKAGSVVRCPKCAGQVVVPLPDQIDEEGTDNPQALANPPAVQPQGREGKLFEQSDFEKLLDESPAGGPQVIQPPPISGSGAGIHGAFADPGLPEYEAVPLGPMKSTSRGIFLTSGVLAVVSALIVVLVGMAFFLGLLLGRSYQP